MKHDRLTIVLLFLIAVTAQAQERIAITVDAGARQTFAGFGSSVANFNGYYEALPPAQRDELSRLIWHDLRFHILRLWMQTFDYAPSPDRRDLAVFRKQFIDSGIIADAQRFGVTTLLLAPDNLPPYMREQHADGKISLKASETKNYARLLAEFIDKLRREHGITLNATGIQNEPGDEQSIAPAQLAEIVQQLRIELDARQLQAVKIIATENASANDIFDAQLDALQRNTAAWTALDGIASHSYNMGATESVAQRIAKPDGTNSKNYWMTESAETGPEKPGDTVRAMAVSARFLNDMNHRVTHWIHFLAFENVRGDDNATCILTFTNNPPAVSRFLKYDAFSQLTGAFDDGSVFRHARSTLDGEMTWTYGLKPRVITAAARNLDGTWAIGIVNYTADDFRRLAANEKWDREQGGHTPAQAFTIDLYVEELKGLPALRFKTHQLDSSGILKADEAVMHHGRLTLAVPSMQLLTLRSVRDD